MSREASRVHQLTNDELIEVLRRRACDFHVLEAFKFLVQMFERTAGMKPDQAQGLRMAAGLTRLYGQSFSHGDPDHPFSAELTLQGILSGGGPTTRPAGNPMAERKPKVVKTPNGNEHHFITVNKSAMADLTSSLPVFSKRARAIELIKRQFGQFTSIDIINLDERLNLPSVNNATWLMVKQGILAKVGTRTYQLVKQQASV